jgi:two-component system OmpR family sensor kinase
LGSALNALARQRATLLRWVVPFGLLLGFGASFLVVSSLLRPLRYMTAEAERIGKGGFGETLIPQGQDEFAALANTLNGMLKRLEQVYRLEQETNRRLEQTIDQQRRFTSDASHELKTPLAVFKTYLGLLKNSKGTVADEAELIQGMDESATRMNGLIQDLLVLARTDAGIAAQRAPCQVEEVVRKAIRATPAGLQRTVVLGGGPGKVLASESELVRVFINLIDNAIKYSGSSLPIEVEILVDDGKSKVLVRDHGAGIPPEHVPHLFERFYRTDQSRTSNTGGSGLGLAICEQIVKSHGGDISICSELGEGTTFTVCLPLCE